VFAQHGNSISTSTRYSVYRRSLAIGGLQRRAKGGELAA
jgi:hypothetical protein